MYAKKRRKIERTEPYSEAEIVYICDLITQLPTAYLIGVWELIDEKPFCESSLNCIQINMRELTPKKLREVELYVKGKHSLLWRSREKKKDKLLALRGKRYKGEASENEN